MRRRRQPRGPVTLESVADELEKLTRYTGSLNGNIERLAGRIQAFEGEKITQHDERRRLRPKDLTLRYIWDMLADADQDIRNAERDLNRIRSYVDSVFSDAVTREEMKEWINRPKDRT